MKNFGLRLKGWVASNGGWSFASSWIRGFSSAVTRPTFLIAIVALLVPASIILAVSSLRATNTITVSTLSDTPASGFCTLREAIVNANAATDLSGGHCTAGTGNDLINFSVTGDIDIHANGTLPAIVNSLTINGIGESITIDGAS